MRNSIFFMLLLISSLSFADDGNDFLSAWEKIQQSSDQVAAFEKIAEGKYHIKFSKLPFEGELLVLSYDSEDLQYGPNNPTPYQTMGYVEVDLVGLPEDLVSKYGRTYYKWHETNTLYLNGETGEWVTGREYSNDLMESSQMEAPSEFLLLFFEYWNYLLVGIILYFFISTLFNNKRVKQSVEVQNQAVEDMKKTIALQNEAMALHRETNDLLKEIRDDLKQQRPQ